MGFISLIPQSDLVYVIQTNGEIEDNLTIEMNDHKNTPKRIPTDTKTIDLSAFPKGNYTLKIEVGGLKTKISIEI